MGVKKRILNDRQKEIIPIWSLFFCMYIIFPIIYQKPYLSYKTKAKRDKTLIKQNYYINGNTVRKTFSPQNAPSRQNVEEIRKQKAYRQAIRRNRQRAMAIGKGTLVAYTVTLIMAVCAAVSLIKIQSSTIILSRQNAALESKIADLKADNDARYKELTSGINLDEIKQRAQELGMKPANENQIVYYEIEHKNYMDQYENVE